MASATLLLVDDDPTTLANFQAILARDLSLRVETAANGVEALEVARRIVPDLIISDYHMPEMDGFEFCRHVKADPTLSSTLFIVLTGFNDTRLRVRGLDIGVDDFLSKPVEVAELTAKVRASLRIKRLNDQLRQDKIEFEHLHTRLEESFEHLLGLLLHMVDLTRPGATERGRRLATLALQLAERFEVPVELRRDLELAALLHEIGRVVETTPRDDWQYIVVSVALLRPVERLSGAAEVVSGICEHWDGTGMPGHLQQGQIPLRSRLLRAGIDFLRAVEGGDAEPSKTPEQAMALLEERRGTWYDPLVLVHLTSVVLDTPPTEWKATRVHLGVEQLQEGMVLASDLTTSSGVKLLAKGATVTRGTREIILRRHISDPIIEGVWIRR
jgi:response regulator RpfG family c-di-GMP phosphodiesterase